MTMSCSNGQPDDASRVSLCVKSLVKWFKDGRALQARAEAGLSPLYITLAQHDAGATRQVVRHPRLVMSRRIDGRRTRDAPFLQHTLAKLGAAHTFSWWLPERVWTIAGATVALVIAVVACARARHPCGHRLQAGDAGCAAS